MGSHLPYDYKVEYLESRNGAYINTLLGTNNNYVIDCRFKVVNPTANISPFGFWVYANTALRIYWRGSGSFYYQYKSTNAINTNIITKDEWHNVLFTSEKVIFDGQQFSPSTASNYVNNNIKFILFGNTSSNTGFEFMSTNESFIDIAYISISLNNSKIADFIPVVKHNVGCMYDKVSKQLFYNSGTGQFIVGPRITSGGGECLVINTLCGYSAERRKDKGI
jgi:hypothetical protein